MKPNFQFTRDAEADILDIWTHLANQDSESAADRVVSHIYSECEKVGLHPAIGHYREELIDHRHRFWSVWSYRIVYRWQSKPVQIIAVIHGARDLDVIFAQRREE